MRKLITAVFILLFHLSYAQPGIAQLYRIWTTGEGEWLFPSGASLIFWCHLPYVPDSVVMEVKYGLCNSPEVPMHFYVNDDKVGTVIAESGYEMPGPEYIEWDVTSSLVPGQNTFKVVTYPIFGDVLLGYIKLLSTERIVGVPPGRPIETPNEFTLGQNYPNPFNPATSITFDISGTGGVKQPVSLTVYDVRGRYVRNLIDSELGSGSHTIHWDGRDDGGRQVPSGIYLYRLKAAGETYMRKMTVLK
jgi:hypothetical protein